VSLQTHGMIVQDQFKAPELKKAAWNIIEKAPVHAIDIWQLGNVAHATLCMFNNDIGLEY
jgi:hypothetical protein